MLTGETRVAAALLAGLQKGHRSNIDVRFFCENQGELDELCAQLEGLVGARPEKQDYEGKYWFQLSTDMIRVYLFPMWEEKKHA